MPRYRAVDPFATRRARRPSRQPATPDPNADETLEPGELARRVADAMSARSAALGLDEASDSTGEPWAEDEAPALDAAESPGEPMGSEDQEAPLDDHTEPQSAPGEVPDGWLLAVQVAEILGVEPAEVRRRCRTGTLTCVKDAAGTWWIDPAKV